MKHSLIAAALTLLCTTAFSAKLEEQAPNLKGIQVVPVEPTPDPDHVETSILFPKNNELKTSSPVKGQIRVSGFTLGYDSEQPRSKEIFNDPKGQSLHIFVDNQPYFSVNEALIDALDDVDEYFDSTADFEIPFKLQPGMHVIRTFPVRSYNESVKSGRAFMATTFYYQEKKNNPQIDLNGPYLTYNEPQGEYEPTGRHPQPILLDFYLTNCELSQDGYKVRLSIDNDNQRTIVSWQPYYIYGLKKGMHTIRLELLDPQNQLVPGLFNDVSRTIVVR
jgi:hypothetical protein